MWKKKPKKTGPARMRQLGNVAVTFWLNEVQRAQLDKVRGNLTRASFAKHMAMNGVRQVLQTQQSR
jgi:hypothetical protein